MLLAIMLSILAASAVTATPLTLEEATARALAASPRILAAKNDASAAAQAASQARARRFGAIDLVGAYNHYESDRLVRPMAIDLFKNPAGGFSQLPWDADQLHYGIAWQIPLLSGGALSEGQKIARLGADSAASTAAFTRTEVRFAVRAAYRNALVLMHAQAAAEAYVAALTRDAADGDLKVRLGTWATVDAEKVRFALAGAQAEREGLRAQGRAAQAALAALMGDEPSPSGYVLEDVPDEKTPPGVPPVDPATALAKRADLAAVQSQASAVERREALAKKSFGPDVAVTGSWLGNRGLSLGDSLPTYEIAVVVKVPLFDGGARLTGLRQAKAARAAADERLRGKRLEAAAQVQDALARLDAAEAQLEAGKTQRALGAEVARVEKLKLDQGTGKIEDYLTAQAQQLRGETAYWQGLYARETAWDYFEFVTGGGQQP
jgi:outer membrane protein